MKFSFKILALIVSLGFAFFNISVSLGILLATAALELIKISHNQMEHRVMSAENLSSKLVFSHFFVVLIIMIITLTIAFLLPQYFNPFGVALTFIADRIFSFLVKATGYEGGA